MRIGSPIKGYGQESRNRAARQRIPHRVWTDEDGVEHIEVSSLVSFMVICRAYTGVGCDFFVWFAIQSHPPFAWGNRLPTRRKESITSTRFRCALSRKTRKEADMNIGGTNRLLLCFALP